MTAREGIASDATSDLAVPRLDRAHRAALHEQRLVRSVTALAVAAGLGVTLLIALPVALLGVLSVSADPLSGTPGGFTLAWYQQLFEDRRWLAPLGLSVMIALVVALLSAAGATLVGRLVPRLGRSKGRLLAVFLLPLVIPGIVLGVQEFIAYRGLLGIRPGIWSLILTHFIWAFPFALLSMLVVTLRFDRTLVEAAADLGASRWRAFVDIEAPLLMPGIVSAAMFGFLLSMTELPRSIFIRGGAMTLPLFVFAEAAGQSSHIPLIYGLNTLVAAVSVALSVAAVLLLSRAARGKETP